MLLLKMLHMTWWKGLNLMSAVPPNELIPEANLILHHRHHNHNHSNHHLLPLPSHESSLSSYSSLFLQTTWKGWLDRVLAVIKATLFKMFFSLEAINYCYYCDIHFPLSASHLILQSRHVWRVRTSEGASVFGPNMHRQQHIQTSLQGRNPSHHHHQSFLRQSCKLCQLRLDMALRWLSPAKCRCWANLCQR